MLIGIMGWSVSIYFVAASFVLILPLLIFVARVSETPAGDGVANNTWGAVKMAFSDRSYTLLFFGFFVCGFHVQFIQTHLPAYIIDEGLAPIVGAWSLALIGLFNIAGSFLSGWSGQIYPKPHSVRHLSDTCNCHHPVHHGTTDRHQCLGFFSCDGDFVAVHSATDHRTDRTDPGIALFIHIGGAGIL